MGIFNKHRHLGPEILSEYLDGRLDQGHQETVARRLADCPVCREELNTLRATVSALQSLPDLPLPRSFTLPAAPLPGSSANLIRKPAPPTPFVMRMPGWAYGGAASVAGLALALMLSAEAAGLASPASFQVTDPATAAPGDAGVAKEAQFEAQVAAKAEPPAIAPEMAAPVIKDRAEPPAGFQAATPPQAAQRAEPAPTPDAATEMGDSALAEKSLAEPAATAPQAAMTESQAASDTVTDPAGEGTIAYSITQSDDVAAGTEDSPPSVLTEEPADPAPTLAMDAEALNENLSFSVKVYSAPSSPAWWKALETMFAALTLAFLGGLFFRWRRNRSQPNA